METTQWQRQDVTKYYLEQVRGELEKISLIVLNQC